MISSASVVEQLRSLVVRRWKTVHLQSYCSEECLVVVRDDATRGAVVVRLYGQFVSGLQWKHAGRERAVERRHTNTVCSLPQLTTTAIYTPCAPVYYYFHHQTNQL